MDTDLYALINNIGRYGGGDIPNYKASKKALAVAAEKLMNAGTGATAAAHNIKYTELLIAVQTGNFNKFEELCQAVTAPALSPHEIKELWAAAVGTQSLEAQAAYPGSAGW